MCLIREMSRGNLIFARSSTRASKHSRPRVGDLACNIAPAASATRAEPGFDRTVGTDRDRGIRDEKTLDGNARPADGSSCRIAGECLDHLRGVHPSANFVFFIYDSPQFITTDTLVPGSSLAFNNSVHPATSVDFIISSPLDPGYADVQITIDPSPGVPTIQDKFVLAADLAQYGTYQFAAGSFGYPNSFLLVAAPEPSSIVLLSVALLGFVGLGWRSCRQPW